MDNNQSNSSFSAPAGVANRPGGAQLQSLSAQRESPEDEEEGLALGEIVAVLMDYRWLIAAVSLFALLLGLAWVFIATPVYRADGLLQVEEKSSGIGALKDLAPLLGDETTASAELEILSSRMILGRVIEKLKLDIVAVPRTLPLIGRAVARRYDGEGPNSPLLGLSSFAWGGERIQVDSLQVPEVALDTDLILIAGENGAFELFDGDDQSVLKGKAG